MEPSEIKLTKTDVDHATALVLDGEGNERIALAVCQTATRHERARLVSDIDDAAIGCPLRELPRMGARPGVDWSIVYPLLIAMHEMRSAK